MNKGWEKIYKEYGVVQTEVMPCVKKFTNFMLRENKKSLKLLDSGCGSGRHTIFIINKLTNHHQDFYLEAFDISKEAIKITKEVLKKSKAVKAPVHLFSHSLDKKLPYKNEGFDGIISTLVMEHGILKQIKKRVNDMKRILKKGGLLAFSVPSIEDPRYLTGENIEPGTKINLPQKDGYLPHHFFSTQEVENLFSGFEILYKKKQERPGETSKLPAKHLEYIFRK